MYVAALMHALQIYPAPLGAGFGRAGKAMDSRCSREEADTGCLLGEIVFKSQEDR